MELKLAAGAKPCRTSQRAVTECGKQSIPQFRPRVWLLVKQLGFHCQCCRTDLCKSECPGCATETVAPRDDGGAAPRARLLAPPKQRSLASRPFEEADAHAVDDRRVHLHSPAMFNQYQSAALLSTSHVDNLTVPYERVRSMEDVPKCYRCWLV